MLAESRLRPLRLGLFFASSALVLSLTAALRFNLSYGGVGVYLCLVMPPLGVSFLLGLRSGRTTPAMVAAVLCGPPLMIMSAFVVALVGHLLSSGWPTPETWYAVAIMALVNGCVVAGLGVLSARTSQFGISDRTMSTWLTKLDSSPTWFRRRLESRQVQVALLIYALPLAANVLWSGSAAYLAPVAQLVAIFAP
jgi:hypothetical protein